MLILLVSAAMSQTTPSAVVTPEPPACSAPEFRQLDFWLGDWHVRWDATKDMEAGSGTNTVTQVLGGCVVQEDFVGGPSTGGLVGRSVSTFHAQTRRWRQTWVDNQGGHFALVGGPEGQRFVLTASGAVGAVPAQRMVFEDITERSLIWRWQTTADAGTTWTDQWVIHYTRAQPLARCRYCPIGCSRPSAAAARQPRWRIDTTAPGLLLTRVVDGERDWRRTREGTIAPQSAAPRQEALQ
jgi:Protein of unknown function (DUF1579)